MASPRHFSYREMGPFEPQLPFIHCCNSGGKPAGPDDEPGRLVHRGHSQVHSSGVKKSVSFTPAATLAARQVAVQQSRHGVGPELHQLHHGGLS